MATRGVVVLGAIGVALCGCASAPTVRAVADASLGVTIEWLGHTVIAFDDERMGGLSGLTHADGRWFAITDHPREPRLVELSIDVDPATARVEVGVVGWTAIDVGAADGESVEWLGEGIFAAGFEAPGVIATLRDTGSLVRRLEVAPAIEEGLRFNRRFEALAVRRGAARELWVGVETALEQDGPEATAEAGALCRVLVFDADSGEPLRQHVYETLPAPRAVVGPVFNSLVGFAALDDGRILALERRLEVFSGYGVTLRLITPGRGETDVSSMDSLRGATFTALRVETLADFGSLNPLGPGNVEGVAIGPEFGDARGGRLVVLVSDDNFGRDGARGSLVIALRLVTSGDAGPSPSAPR